MDDEKEQASDLESSFARELKRRGISSTDDIDEPRTGPKTTESGTVGKEEQQSTTSSGSTDGQLKRSRALNSEGIEGLIPRASLLVRVGGTFFLGFLPLIGGVALLFAILYWGFGEGFVHTGATTQPTSTYIDPYELLSEPTVDPYYPVR